MCIRDRKQAFPDYQYVSMEDPDIYALATTDARGFFDRYSEGVIIDEAQKVPNLFSYMQSIVDKKRTPGRFVLSGSQNYLLHRNITQSLACLLYTSPYAYLDGSTKDRKAAVEHFEKNDHIRLFLISLKAGNTGLNLIKADYVYLRCV